MAAKALILFRMPECFRELGLFPCQEVRILLGLAGRPNYKALICF